MALELRPVQTDEEWAAMHDIRRATLFAPGRSKVDVVYDDNHPDDRAEGHVPHLLMLDEEPIGMARLDLKGDIAIVRLVAIVAARRRQGFGELMDKMLTEKAWELGVRQLRVNAAPDAVGFYEKTGWRREVWDKEELVGIASTCVQMVKDLA
jgi:GNAT superfamily N-acetyltransferase